MDNYNKITKYLICWFKKSVDQVFNFMWRNDKDNNIQGHILYIRDQCLNINGGDGGWGGGGSTGGGQQ